VVKIQATDFKAALAAIQPAIGANKIIDLYEYVIMEECDDASSVRLRAKSDGIQIQSVIPASKRGNSDLPLMLHGTKLVAILKNTDDDDVVEIKADKVISVRAGGAHYRLLRRECDTFPDPVNTKIKDKIMTRAIKLSVVKGRLEFVGLNNHRGAVCSIDITKKQGSIKQTILVLPANLMAVVSAAPEDSELVIMSSNKCLTITFNSTAMALTALDGSFADIHRLTPAVNDGFRRVKLFSAPTIRAIKQASIVTSKISRAVTFVVSKGETTIKATDATTGAAEVIVESEGESEFEFSANPDYITSLLSVVEDPTIQQDDRIGAGPNNRKRCRQRI